MDSGQRPQETRLPDSVSGSETPPEGIQPIENLSADTAEEFTKSQCSTGAEDNSTDLYNDPYAGSGQNFDNVAINMSSAESNNRNKDLINKITAAAACICFSAVVLAGIIAASIPQKPESQKIQERLEKDFSQNVKIALPELRYEWIDPDAGNIILYSNEPSYNDFYDILCAVEDIREYAETRDDFSGKDLKVNYSKKVFLGGYYTKQNPSEIDIKNVGGFSVTFKADGDIVFFYNFSEDARLSEISRVFPTLSSFECSQRYSEYAAENISDMAGLLYLKSIKLDFDFGIDRDGKYEERIKEVFPDCNVEIKRKEDSMTEKEIQMYDFNLNVKLRKSDWSFTEDLMDLGGPTDVRVFIAGGGLHPEDFYDMLLSMRETAEYMNTRDDCRNKNITVGFEDYYDSYRYSFWIKYDVNGDVKFYSNWRTVLFFDYAAEVFPEITDLEFDVYSSYMAANNIEAFSELKSLKRIKFIFRREYNITPEQEEKIENLLPDCDIIVEYVD